MQKLMSMNNLIGSSTGQSSGTNVVKELVAGIRNEDQIKSMEIEIARQGDIVSKLYEAYQNEPNSSRRRIK